MVKGNIRDTWKLINNVLNDVTGLGHKSYISEIKHNDHLLEEPESIADKFNEYFTNVGPNLAKNIQAVNNRSIYDTLPKSNQNSMF